MQKILKLDLILQIMNYIDHCLKEKYKKDKLGGKIMTKFVGLRVKSYSYLIDDDIEKGTIHKSVIKRKLKFEKYKNCLEANQLENKINDLEKKSNLHR